MQPIDIDQIFKQFPDLDEGAIRERQEKQKNRRVRKQGRQSEIASPYGRRPTHLEDEDWQEASRRYRPHYRGI